MTTRRGEFYEWGNESWGDNYTTAPREEPMSARSGRMDGEQEREARRQAWLGVTQDGLTRQERESVADILRPLVEATVEDVRPDEVPFPRSVLIPDPRFDALRLILDPEDYATPPSWEDTSRLIDASLGAIVRAAAACGYMTTRKVLEALLDWYDEQHGGVPQQSPEEAAARALVAAWRDEKAHSATGGMQP